MSVTGIATSVLAAMNALHGAKSGHTSSHSIQSELGQLGADLQSGNLSQAQSDFATLAQSLPNGTLTSSATSATANPLAQSFAQLGKDLQSGNVSAAKQDYATIQLELRERAAEAASRHHHHQAGGSESASTQQANPVAQAFSQLAADLQSGNLQASQSDFAALQSGLQQFGGWPAGAGASGSSSALASAVAGGLNVVI
jgi:outer membrane protein assembly factor BamD (BamD/ComL family)